MHCGLWVPVHPKRGKVAGPVKLLMTWDIRPDQEEAYLAFITDQFPTVFREAGLQLTDAWHTVYGDWPQVTIAFRGESLAGLRDFAASALWRDARQRLLTYVLRYQQKIIPAKGGYQL